MANDTPGSDAQPGERRPDDDTAATLHTRPDQPAVSGSTSPYARPAVSWPQQDQSAPQGSSTQPQGSPAQQHGSSVQQQVPPTQQQGPSTQRQGPSAPQHGSSAPQQGPRTQQQGPPTGQQALAGPYGVTGHPGPGQQQPGHGTSYAPGHGSGGRDIGATGQFAGPGPFGAAPPHPYPPQARRRRGIGALVAVGIVAALLGGGVGGAVGATLAGGNRSGGSSGALADPLPEPDAGSTPLGPVEAVAERVLPSVVRLLVRGPTGAGEGSGMVLSSDGLMLTNNHVVESAATGGTIVAVFQDGTTAPAGVVGLDPSSDLAVIRAQGVSGLTPIEFGDSDAVRVGQQVVAFGSPLGLGGTVTTGIVSAVDRAVSVGEGSGASEATVLSALQTDAAINPGNSGGPLTDMQGRVVGINSVIATTGAEGGSIGVGFAIPTNQARRTAQELETTGRATRAILGAGVNAGGPADELAGAVLQSIVPGGPADQAGLQPGQVVTRVGDRMVTKGDDLIAAIRENAPGDEVTLVVDGQPINVTLSGETS